MPALTSASRTSARYPLRSRRPAQPKKTAQPPASSRTATSAAACARKPESKKQKVKHGSVLPVSKWEIAQDVARFCRERKVRFVDDNNSEDEECPIDVETPEPAIRPPYSLPSPALLPDLPPSPPLQPIPGARSDETEYPLRYIPYKSPPQVYLPRPANTLPSFFHLTSPVDPSFFRSIAPSPQPSPREEQGHLSVEVPPVPPPFAITANFDSFSLPPPLPPPSITKPALEQLDLHSLLDLVESTIPGTSPSVLSYLSSSSFLDLAPPSPSALYPSQPPSASMSDFSLPTTPHSAISAASSTLTFSSSPFATEQAQLLISPDGRAELSFQPVAKDVVDEQRCVKELRAGGYASASSW
ncbi:hypothetical protein JCM8547_005270 [Rhodosporidiobolus lusitaniae]